MSKICTKPVIQTHTYNTITHLQSYVKYNTPYLRLTSVTQTEIQTYRVTFETAEHPKLQIHICRTSWCFRLIAKTQGNSLHSYPKHKNTKYFIQTHLGNIKSNAQFRTLLLILFP